MLRPSSFVAGKRLQTEQFAPIHSPYDGELVSEVGLAGATDMNAAIESAYAARETFRRFAVHRRAAIAEAVAQRLAARSEELAELVTRESGKPIRYARAELARAVTTFTLGASVARTLGGEVLPADIAPSGEGRLLLYRRVPRGVVAGIAPFNFPVNLVAHKLSPALAVGAPVVLKPPHQAPSAGLLLAEMLNELGVPAGCVNALHAEPAVAEQLARDPRIAVLSFTGSDRVGFRLQELASKKQVLLELGGNAPVIIDETADLDAALPQLVEAAWANAGQVCIKAQRLIVHERLFEEFTARFVAATREVVAGDPMDERTVVGPLIERRHVDRVLGLVRDACATGARVLTGGDADGQVVLPTVLVDASPELAVCREEVFGPVTVLASFESFEQALALANDTRFGLQASLFTRELDRALLAFEALEYGGVLVNEPPSFRLDHYPYGGTKDSGHGREGVRFAAEELTEPRVLVLSASGASRGRS